MRTFVVVPIFKGDLDDVLPQEFIFDVPYDGDYSFVISDTSLSVVISGSIASPTKKVEAIIISQYEEIPHGYTLQWAFEFDSLDENTTTDEITWHGICTKDSGVVAYAWKKQF